MHAEFDAANQILVATGSQPLTWHEFRRVRFQAAHAANVLAWSGPLCRHPQYTQCTWSGPHYDQGLHHGRCCRHLPCTDDLVGRLCPVQPASRETPASGVRTTASA